MPACREPEDSALHRCKSSTKRAPRRIYSPECVEGEFSELRVDGVLPSWLRGSAGGIMLVVEGDIPLSLKRKSPVVDLIEERSPDQSSNDRKSFWRFVLDHFY